MFRSDVKHKKKAAGELCAFGRIIVQQLLDWKLAKARKNALELADELVRHGVLDTGHEGEGGVAGFFSRKRSQNHLKKAKAFSDTLDVVYHPVWSSRKGLLAPKDQGASGKH